MRYETIWVEPLTWTPEVFYLPLNHDLRGVDCLVIGAGVTALRKIEWLLKAEASVRVIAPDVSQGVAALDDRLIIEQMAFSGSAIRDDTRLIVAATNDKVLNSQIYDLAVARNILINSVDDPERCTVTFPAIIDRSPVVVSVSTSGTAPALARIARGWVEEALPAGLGRVASWIAGKRQAVKDRFPTADERVHLWDSVLSREVVAAVASHDDSYADAVFTRALAKDQNVGFVSLVGAGPGDPELITLKALRAIQAADVILYDKLANADLMDYARRDALKIDVGKQGPKPNETPTRRDNRGAQQSSINDAIVEHALAGRRVVRLKGGDPFIYGRGGEELEALAAHSIEFEVIPGITASLGAASYAGIPLTHRNLSQSVRFVTGHRVENTVNLDWPEFAHGGQTLVIYMGLVGLPVICERLIEHGAPSERPVAIIEHATRPEQRIIEGTLQDIARKVDRARITGPSILIIGEVVGLRALWRDEAY